jgi:hypothetical protein
MTIEEAMDPVKLADFFREKGIPLGTAGQAEVLRLIRCLANIADCLLTLKGLPPDEMALGEQCRSIFVGYIEKKL